MSSRRAFDLDAAELLVPRCAGLAADLLEIPLRYLGVEVLQRVGRADGRDGRLDQDGFVLLRLILGQELQVRPKGLGIAAEAIGVVDHRLAVAEDA